MILDLNQLFSQSLVLLALLNKSHTESLDGLIFPLDLVLLLDYLLLECVYPRLLLLKLGLPLKL
jgi:hypothetical protein